MEVVEHRHRVMASDTHVMVVGGAPGAPARAAERLAQLEQRWSRFLPDSDITRLNSSAGQAVRVHPDTITLVEHMIDAHVVTCGGYDPTILPTLLAAGYTASVDDPTLVTPTLPPTSDTSGPWRLFDVELDRRASTVTLPEGVSLDPGGIGKGLAADIVVAELLDAGARGALVSIGGDLAADGESPTDDGWLVVVEHPLRRDQTLMTLAVDAGGVCTSSTMSRRWRHERATVHHLIDPVRRRVADTDLAAVTVVAASAWLAEVHATAALLRGSAAATASLEAVGLVAIATTVDGRTTRPDWLGAPVSAPPAPIPQVLTP